MLNQISTGSASQFAYHRRDAGISAYDSALTGIRASRSQLIKRTDAQSANAASEQKASSPVSAGISAATMLAASKAEASGGQGAKENLRPGRAVAIDIYLTDTIKISDEGRELAAKISESNSAPADKSINAFDLDALSAILGLQIQGPAETLEERVVNREKGLELAKYFAEDFIDDPAAKQTFLDRAKEMAKNAELLDIGYLVVMTMDGGRSVTNIDDNLLITEGKLTEKAAADIINRVKNSLDMNAVKEDALNTLKKFIADYTKPKEQKIVSHIKPLFVQQEAG